MERSPTSRARDLFVYIDEAGNLGFNRSATSWYYFTALSTFEPSIGLSEWHDIKHDAIRAGVYLEELHAAEDRQWIRDRVFGLLSSTAVADSIRIDAIAVEKRKTHPTLRPGHVFYRRIAEYLIQYVIAGRTGSFDRIFLFLDTIPVARKRKEIIGALKITTAALLPTVPYVLEERDSRGEHLLQLADYCSWALYVARERKELRPRGLISPLIHSDFAIFRTGTIVYY